MGVFSSSLSVKDAPRRVEGDSRPWGKRKNEKRIRNNPPRWEGRALPAGRGHGRGPEVKEVRLFYYLCPARGQPPLVRKAERNGVKHVFGTKTHVKGRIRREEAEGTEPAPGKRAGAGRTLPRRQRGDGVPPNRPARRHRRRSRHRLRGAGGSRARRAEISHVCPKHLPWARDLPPPCSRRPAALPPRPPLETQPNNT